MADSTISQLPVASTLTGAELLPLVQSGVTTRATAMQFATLVAATGFGTMSVQNSNNVTITGGNVSGITLTGSTIVGNSLFTSIATKTSSYSVVATDCTLLGNAVSSSITITLPDATSNIGRQIAIKKVDISANTVSVATLFSQTIDGLSGVTFSLKNQGIWVQSDGANWQIIAVMKTTFNGSINS